MHELGAITNILKAVERVMAEENLTQVDTIVLQVGELSGVVPSLIEECYPAAVFQTPFENTRLELERIPGMARCNACGAEYDVFKHKFKCPECGSLDMTPLSGREFLIKEIHAT